MQAFRASKRPPRPCGAGQTGHNIRPRGVGCKAAPAAPTTLKTVEGVASWAVSKGAKMDKAQVAADIKTDQPVLVAAADAQAGDALVAVPEAVWLSPASAQRTSIGKAAADAGLEPWLQIALQLVADRFGPAAAASDLKPYALSLPSDLGSPLLWSEAELKELQGTQLMQSLTSYMAFFKSTFQQLQQGLFASSAAAFPASAFTYENFLWAVVAVRSRSLAPLEGAKIALAPVVDLVVHRRSSNTRLALRSASLFGRGQSLVVEATKPIRKGETLSLDYGPDKLDSAVLLDYGVIDATTPKPGYSLALTLPSTDRFFDDKIDIIETNNLQQTMTYNLSPLQEPSQEMLGFLRLMQLQGSDAFLLESLFRNDVWGFVCDPVSEGNEASTCKAMADFARAALGAYPTTIDEDLALERTGQYPKGSRNYTALMIRLGEKEALEATLRFFEERSSSQLKRLVYYQERRLRRLGLVDDEGRTTYDSFFKDGIA